MTSATERTFLIFGAIAFLYFTGEVFKPLALAVLLSFALLPVARMFERLRMGRVPAVLLTTVLALSLIGGVGFVVGQQLTSLAKRLPAYQENIEKKLRAVFPTDQPSTADRLTEMVNEVTAKLERPRAAHEGDAVPVTKVQVVDQPSFQDRLRSSSGPYVEFLGVGSFVLILVLFILVGRDDLRDRLVALFGHRRVGVTTRTLEEIGQKISRYLASVVLVNLGVGLVIGIGLRFIGLPYAVLWGCLAGLLRFIPYVGPAAAFSMPLVFSFAHFPGWREPIEVVALFGVLEAALSSFVEPVFYGKSTGVSALGLLVAAMFWTWLWGVTGLLLSTPLTVCLAVLGKVVPSLRFLDTLLGEEAELEPAARLYQRLMALDREGALDVIQTALRARPRAKVFDELLVPTLCKAKRDAVRGELEKPVQAFVWQVIGERVDELRETPESALTLGSSSAPSNGEVGEDADAAPIRIVGVAPDDTGDALPLSMLEALLDRSGIELTVLDGFTSPLQAAERLAELSPTFVIVSHVPAAGLTPTRYLVRRLRARFPNLQIIVGRWGQNRASASISAHLMSAGASRVVFSLDDARDMIMKLAHGSPVAAAAAPLPA
jgi:predicted PurR-regulated permease PerM